MAAQILLLPVIARPRPQRVDPFVLGTVAAVAVLAILAAAAFVFVWGRR